MISFAIKDRPLDMFKSDIEYFSIENHIKLRADGKTGYFFKKNYGGYNMSSNVKGKFLIQDQPDTCSIIFDRTRFILSLLVAEVIIILCFVLLLLQRPIDITVEATLLFFIPFSLLFSIYAQRSRENRFLQAFTSFFARYIESSEQIKYSKSWENY